MSYCTCVYAGYDSDQPDFITTKKPKARKAHKCHECGREIQPGETYCRDSGKWYGKMLSFKTCTACSEVVDVFFCDGFAYGQIYSDLYEHIQEMRGQISEACLASLSKDARALVCEEIERYWQQEND